MDFLQRQHWTRWVGYDTADGHVVWPVFSGDDFRAKIDEAIEAAIEAASRRANQAGGKK
jgi:hypothetical protein